MSERSVELTMDGAVARVRLAAPERGNPFDMAFTRDLCEIANACDEDRAVRAVLIDGPGRFFSVGGDLASLSRDREALPLFIKSATAQLHVAVSRFARMDAPVVLAVHAMAAGGAVALAAGADFCLAGRSARFYAAFLGVGLAVDTGMSYFLPRRVGTRRATEFLLRNQTWTAEEAERYGLVGRVVEDDQLDAEALALARELAAGPTRSYGEVKRLLLSSAEHTLEAQLEDEARAMGRVTHSDDTWNALCAVAAKQKATFTGS
jgi:2-(1,2-epoxy-1,2-dihydrophenyl)acetyl-CoA isomerase